MMQTSSRPSSTGCMCFLLKWKMLSSRVMFLKVSCITPFRQLITALEVAKNGLPRMIGTSLAAIAPGYVSSTTKSTG